ncbi:MAG: radical SAM/SPASM domain-containing protein [Candidatus Aenigmatarchaeota archaeon]
MRYKNKFQVFKDYILKSLSYHLNYPLVKPERINLATTFKCPLNCEMCALEEDDEKEEMVEEDWEELIDQIVNWGIRHVSFSGGETLSDEEKTVSLMGYAKEKGLEIDLITNGFFMDEKTTKKIIETGVDRISLSVDGHNRKTHDSVRGEGSFEKIERAIENMNRHRDLADHIEYEFTTVVLKKNYKNLVSIYEFMKENGFDFINYQALIPDNSFSNGQDYNDELWLDGEEAEKLERITQELIEIKKETGDIRNSKKYLRVMPEYFKNKDDFRYGKCMAGYEVVHIDPYGNIDLCGFGPNINVRNKKLKEVWRGDDYRMLRKKVKKCEKPCLLLCYRKLDLEDMYRTHVESMLDGI